MKKIMCSFRSGLYEPIRDVDMYKFLTTDYYDEQLEKIRSTEDKEERQELKKLLGAITPSARFEGRMREENILEHTGRLCVDIDGADNIYTADSMKEVLCNLSNVEFAALSASGNGVYCIIPIDPEKHRESFDYIQHWFQEELNITIDSQCHNISRLRFASSDKEYYYNDNAERLEIGDWVKPAPELPAVTEGLFDTKQPYKDFIQYCERYEGEFAEGGRNRWIYQKACKAREKFGLDAIQAEAALMRYSSKGFSPQEIRTSVRSAYRS